jgi:hypothetical protein
MMLLLEEAEVRSLLTVSAVIEVVEVSAVGRRSTDCGTVPYIDIPSGARNSSFFDFLGPKLRRDSSLRSEGR